MKNKVSDERRLKYLEYISDFELENAEIEEKIDLMNELKISVMDYLYDLCSQYPDIDEEDKIQIIKDLSEYMEWSLADQKKGKSNPSKSKNGKQGGINEQ